VSVTRADSFANAVIAASKGRLAAIGRRGVLMLAVGETWNAFSLRKWSILHSQTVSLCRNPSKISQERTPGADTCRANCARYRDCSLLERDLSEIPVEKRESFGGQCRKQAVVPTAFGRGVGHSSS